MADDAFPHSILMAGIVGVATIFLAIAGILFNLIYGIRRDHVQRSEFEALRSRIDTIADRQSMILERLDDTRQRINMIEREAVVKNS